jgi:leucyl-tRNA synthetase
VVGFRLGDAHEARGASAHDAGAATVSYRLRDWLFSRQRYWGEPFPIVYDESDLPVALPAAMLPVELPDMADFAPPSSPVDW